MAEKGKSIQCSLIGVGKKNKRAVNPRTGKDDGKEGLSCPGKYRDMLADPWELVSVYYSAPWIKGAVRAIKQGIEASEVRCVFDADDPKAQADPKLMQILTDFLEKDDEDWTTSSERMAACVKDFGILGYACFEIARDTKRMPAAWYHVPAVTIRERKDKLYDQIDMNGTVIRTFGKYTPKGREDKLPELMIIREYDPAGRYTADSPLAGLVNTGDRLNAQDDYNTQLLRKGGLSPLLLMLEGELDPEGKKRFKEELRGIAAGKYASVIALLENVPAGSAIHKMAQEMTDASFTEGEKTLRDRVLANYTVPPTKVSLTASNYATAMQEDATFRFMVTQPYLRKHLKRLTVVGRELVADKGYCYGFRQDSISSFLEQVQAEDLLLKWGARNINTTLAKLGDKGIGPEGDKHYLMTNLGPVALEDLEKMQGTPTLGRLIDNLMAIRAEISRARDHNEDDHRRPEPATEPD
jgi:hypothetical protein